VLVVWLCVALVLLERAPAESHNRTLVTTLPFILLFTHADAPTLKSGASVAAVAVREGQRFASTFSVTDIFDDADLPFGDALSFSLLLPATAAAASANASATPDWVAVTCTRMTAATSASAPVGAVVGGFCTLSGTGPSLGNTRGSTTFTFRLVATDAAGATRSIDAPISVLPKLRVSVQLGAWT